MSARYSKRSKQQIHWTHVGYNSVLQGVPYEEIRTKDALVNTWITEGRAKAMRKHGKKALQLSEEGHTFATKIVEAGPKVAIIAASQLDPNNWTASHNIRAAKQRQATLEMAGAAVLKEAGKGGWTIKSINAVIERLQPIVKPCPCCGSEAKLYTYDYMTFGIECPHCRVKVERGIVNERGVRQCLQLVISAWNQRINEP